MSHQDLSDNPLYTIGSAARILGISVHTLRMYERNGLIIPYKSSARQRLYSDEDIERIRNIREAISVEKISIAGLQKIFSLIPCWSIMHCGESTSQQCPAYQGHSEPCWSLKEKGTFCINKDCRTCDVYKSFGNLKNVKDRLRRLLPV